MLVVVAFQAVTKPKQYLGIYQFILVINRQTATDRKFPVSY